MNAIINLGKYLYAIPFALFGFMHFANAGAMAGMAPGGEMMVYATGAALVAAAAGILLGKMDKLAAVLLGLMLLIFVGALHLPEVMSGDEAKMMTAMPNMLKDIALAGAAWMYAGSMAKDDAVIG